MSQKSFSVGGTLLFMGDSITDCGRTAAAQGGHPLGDGYVRLFSDLLRAVRPGTAVECVNKGISGNTIMDLSRRWGDDAVACRPDWLSVMIGINDIHRWLEGSDRGVSPEMFRKAYDELLGRTARDIGCDMIVLDPFYISLDGGGDPFRNRVIELLPEYIAGVAEAAEKHGAARVRTHEAFRRRMEHVPAEIYCPEPVHPNRTGHTVIAWELFSLLCGAA